MNLKDFPVFILAGGLGTRIKEMTEFIPKPMVPVGEFPILHHIMMKYSLHGFKKFVICTGYKSEVIKSYFLNYSSLNSDFTVKLSKNELTIHSIDHQLDWEVTVAFTGLKNMTGSRIAIAADKYLNNAKHFAVTYGDGLTDANLKDELEFHLNNDKIGTVLAVNPPSRFGEFVLKGDRVESFKEKPEFTDDWINGGYFFFKKDFLKYLSEDPDCVLEKQPLVNLTEDKQLNIYKHRGFWASMDTQRDRENINEIWESGTAPWTNI
jgi:glucose-1-phosphate cytidylyltransferase